MSTYLLVVMVFIASISSALLLLRLLARLTYTDVDRLRDRLRGVRVEFPLFWPFVAAFLSWAYVVVRPV